MAVTAIQNEYGNNYFLEAKRQTARSLLIAKVWAVPTIVGCYLTYIVCGNYLMKNRKPMKMKFLMLGFNAFQIFYNLYLFWACARSRIIVHYISNICDPMDRSEKEIWAEGYGFAYLFFISKLVDLIDTVFLVLLKKVQQITFLHLYHHIGMVTFTWIILKYYSDTCEQALIVILLNSFVHVVMYFYYLLSLLGPLVQKYLWWKRYVTMLQLAQFVIYMGYMTGLLVFGCRKPKEISVFVLTQAVIFFSLFKIFYDEHYRHPNKCVSAVKSTSKYSRK